SVPRALAQDLKQIKEHEYLSTYILLSTIYKPENNLLISIKTLIPLLILYTLHYRNVILRLHRDLLLSSLLFHLHLSHLLRVTYDRGNIDIQHHRELFPKYVVLHLQIATLELLPDFFRLLLKRK